MQQRGPNHRQRRDLGSTRTDGLVANGLGDVLSFQNDDHAMSVAGSAELHIQMLGKHLQGFLVGQIDAVITRSECQQTVQGAGVEKIPAELTREQRGNGSCPIR